MRVEVRVESADSELRSLLSWLRNDPGIRRSTALEMREAAHQQGHMGTVADILHVVTENGWNAANFVLALAAWKRTRPRNPDVTIRREDLVVALTDCSDEQVAHIIRLLQDEQGEDKEGTDR